MPSSGSRAATIPGRATARAWASPPRSQCAANTLGYAGPAAGLLDAETNLRYGLKYLESLQARRRRHLRFDPALSVRSPDADHDERLRAYCAKVKVIGRSRLEHRTQKRIPVSSSISCSPLSLAHRAVAPAPLTARAFGTTSPPSVGRAALRARLGEESPGSMEARCRITSGGGQPRESATESRPPLQRSSDLQGQGEGVR